jgi:hypothetical protein
MDIPRREILSSRLRCYRSGDAAAAVHGIEPAGWGRAGSEVGVLLSIAKGNINGGKGRSKPEPRNLSQSGAMLRRSAPRRARSSTREGDD